MKTNGRTRIPRSVGTHLAPSARTANGRISSAAGGVGGLAVELVDKNAGPDRLLAKGTTDSQGNYSLEVPAALVRRLGNDAPDLQVRVFNGSKFLGASEVRYNAEPNEVIDVVLPDEASKDLPSEHAALTSALAERFKGNLANLKETDERADITYLANKTGWDARVVAMAALAKQFSQRSRGAKIPAPFFYALFRAGLPANEGALYHASEKTIQAVWKHAAEKGIIPKNLAREIPRVAQRFQKLAAEKLLTDPASIGPSSLKEILSVSKLSSAEAKKFAALHTQYRNDPTTLWKEAEKALGNKARRLQEDGRLAFMTINNAPLMSRIRDAAKDQVDGLALAQNGYHRPDQWIPLLTPDVAVPNEIAGQAPDEKRANYAKFLAAQVRLAYPTASIAQMVRSRDLPLTGAPMAASDAVADFLTAHQGQFELGVEPIHQYIARTKTNASSETVKQVARLQRVQQITPGDQAMKTLIQRGMDSSYHITRLDKADFVARFSADIGSAEEAAFTYDRSVHVHNAVLNIALGYLTARTAPAIGVHSPPSVVDPSPHATDIIAYGSLEAVFGSMDYCACDHCRSLLSPAAYLVDLLQFIDLRRYDATGAEILPHAFAGTNPFEVLMDRRPDIQYLPLTCENTNTALPYIDLVLETLEYFVNKALPHSLDGFQGHDTAGLSSEDLMASPQYVIENAYNILQGKWFPIGLPFNQPLENLRRHFRKFELPLSRSMEQLRKTDNFERGPNAYGWRDIWMEELGLSREEHQALTHSPAAVSLAEAHGFPAGMADNDVQTALSNARKYAKRLNVSYEELLLILKTRFINPNSDLILKLERLGVSFAVLAALKNGTLADAAFDALLPTGAGAPDPAQYGGDIKAWVKNNANFDRIMSLITLVVPAMAWSASHAYVTGDCAKPTAPPAGSTLYYECTTAGTSAAAQPVWPSSPGVTINDGTVVWTCRDAAGPSNFNNFAFRYANPASVTQDISIADYTRLLRFIRLWRTLEKVGWTLDQVDVALCSMFPPPAAGQPFSTVLDSVADLNDGFLFALPRFGIVMRLIEVLKLNPRRDLRSLLACFAPIGVHDGGGFFANDEGGREERLIPSLYRQMFLDPSLLKQNAAFADNGYGAFLQNSAEKILAHTESLRSAFNVTAAELGLILEALGFDRDFADVPYTHGAPALEQPILDAGPGLRYDHAANRLGFKGILTAANAASIKAVAGTTVAFQNAVDALYAANQAVLTSLTLENLSAIFRRSWLARKLKISVRELLSLISVTGLDPFALPNPPARPAILRLIDLVQLLREQSLKLPAALYLVWNQDLSGRSAPEFNQIANFARTLRRDLVSVATEFAPADDPDGTIAQARLTLVYGVDATAFYFSLLNDTFSVTVPFSDPDAKMAPGAILDAINLAAGQIAVNKPRLTYDDFQKTLTFTGVLTVALRNAIVGAAGAASVAFTTALDQLRTQNSRVVEAFFQRYAELEIPFTTYMTSPGTAAERRSALLAGILPELIRRRKVQQAFLSISAATQTSLELTQALLGPSPTGLAADLAMHALAQPAQPAVNDFLALETQGLSARFFNNDTASGAPLAAPPVAAKLEYGPQNRLPRYPALGAGIWSGYVEAPDNGVFKLQITAEAGASVSVKLGSVNIPLNQVGAVWSNAAAIELRAGTLYAIELTVGRVQDILRVQWEWTPKGQGRAAIAPVYLYPAALFSAFEQSYLRFLKVSVLAGSLGLTAKEIVRFATDADYQIAAENWLNQIPARGNAAPATAAALVSPLRALLEFSSVKTNISPGSDALLTALLDPSAATASPTASLYTMTQWDPGSLAALVAHFGGDIAGLKRWPLFSRVYDAFTILQNVGISASALIQATTNAPSAAQVRDFQAALRARYDAADWRQVAKPINDEMRDLQRDALVAYILHHLRSNPVTAHIDTANKLFEYFLMDVQMEPIMQTSRIRFALSSVQLFIERCLMNLETRVSPDSINAQRWGWMKRYRVWEANRKVYLWPENWLEPELRDDKSPFFKEIESQLLQSDITADSASTAALEYLTRLEEVAKLEPCGFHYLEADQLTNTPEKYFVVARTAGASRKYYFRKKEYGYWTAWEQIKLEIEDNPVVPYLWKSKHGPRLLLFWLKILTQSSADADGMSTSIKDDAKLGDLSPKAVQADSKNQAKQNTKVKFQAMLCWSEYYNGKWQAAKTSDASRPVSVAYSALKNFDRSQLKLSITTEDDTLTVNIDGGDGAGYTMYNTHSLPVPNPFSLNFHWVFPHRVFETFDDLEVIYRTPRILMAPIDLNRPLLTQNAIDGRVVEPCNDVSDPWTSPFFFADSRHAFLVTSEKRKFWESDPIFGVFETPTWDFKIPPLVREIPPWRKGPPEPPWERTIPVKDITVRDAGPRPVEQFLSEDANIRVAIGDKSTFKFGESTIGLKGGIKEVAASKQNVI